MRLVHINSLWHSDTIWCQGSGSTLAQVMACCQMAPSHYLNQCRLINTDVLWHASECNFTGSAQDFNLNHELENFPFEIIAISCRGIRVYIIQHRFIAILLRSCLIVTCNIISTSPRGQWVNPYSPYLITDLLVWSLVRFIPLARLIRSRLRFLRRPIPRWPLSHPITIHGCYGNIICIHEVL